MSDSLLLKALFISLTLHTIIVCSSYWMRLPDIRKAHQKRVEITYKPRSPKSLDIQQHAVKPAQKLDLKNTPISSSNDTVGLKVDKDNQNVQGFTKYERKPAQIKSTQVNFITVTPIKSEKIDSPVYISYQERIRESIKERVYANYNRLDNGSVYLTFVIGSNGSLVAYKVIEDKTQASQNLQYISTKSLKEAKFPPFLKGMTLPEYTFNIEVEYQVGG